MVMDAKIEVLLRMMLQACFKKMSTTLSTHIPLFMYSPLIRYNDKNVPGG